jgi:hypothetical protein
MQLLMGVPPKEALPEQPISRPSLSTMSREMVNDPGLRNRRTNKLTRFPAGAVPLYTREHLHKLSAALNSRLGDLEAGHSSYPSDGTKSGRRIPLWATITMAVLGALWLTMSVVNLYYVIKSRMKNH